MNTYKHLLKGIDKITNEIITPQDAKITNNKNCICFECKKSIQACRGEIITKAYFRHIVDKDNKNECVYYEKNINMESIIHKEAKYRLKKILQNNINISMIRKCIECKEDIFYDMFVDNNYNIIVEYPFKYNKKEYKADVAVIQDNEIICIFEICYTNKTNPQNRPEPWFETDAKKFIDDTEDLIDNPVTSIKCMRLEYCDKCAEKKKYVNNEGKIIWTDICLKFRPDDLNFFIKNRYNLNNQCWKILSRNKYAVSLLKMYIYKIDWEKLCSYVETKEQIELIENNISILTPACWKILSSDQYMVHLLKNNIDKIVWEELCMNIDTEEQIKLIENNISKLTPVCWKILNGNIFMSYLLENNIDKIDWERIMYKC